MPTTWNRLSASTRNAVTMVAVAASGIALGGIVSVATGGMSASSAETIVGVVVLLALMGVAIVAFGLLSARLKRLVSSRTR